MLSQDKDKLLRELIGRVAIPPGLRPTNSGDIEALLDAIGGDTFSEDEIERILRKAKGELPVGQRGEAVPEIFENVSEQEAELIALHRSQGTDLPPEIKAKLDALRKQARTEKQPGSGDTCAD